MSDVQDSTEKQPILMWKVLVCGGTWVPELQWDHTEVTDRNLKHTGAEL